MASILRQIVAGPRSRHPEANLDLCYVTHNIIATSGPSATYPSLAYRNPLSDLVTFLDSKHGDQWCLFEFRAEGCGYPDEQVYGRIWHWPWPDHHPPPFALVPQILGSMRAWLAGSNTSGTNENLASEDPKRVAVVHCKAGKGRSGTMAVSYMMTHQGWSKTDALQRFTERRMRPGFGTGVSIPSQLRWLDYVERWASQGNKYYVERPAQVVEVHVWGLREGVTIAVEGYVEQGKKIKVFHVFDKGERDDSTQLPTERGDGAAPKNKGGFAEAVQDVLRRQKSKLTPISRSRSQSPARTPISSDDLTAIPPSRASEGPVSPNRLQVPSGLNTPSTGALSRSPTSTTREDSGHPETPAGETTNVIFRPSTPVQLASSDINLAVERRASVGYGFSTVTSVAHVWFNCFFEGNGPENYQNATQRTAGKGISVGENSETTTWAKSSGVFTIDWDAMDGIKGSSRKGTRAFDKVSVVWRTTGDEESGGNRKDWGEFGQSHGSGIAIAEPRLGESIKPLKAADAVEEASQVEREPVLSGLGGSPISRVDNSKIVAPRGEQSVGNEDGGASGGVALPGDEVDEDGAEGVRHGVVDGHGNETRGPDRKDSLSGMTLR